MRASAEGPYHQTSIVRADALNSVNTWFTGLGYSSQSLFQWFRASYYAAVLGDKQDPIFFLPNPQKTPEDRQLDVPDDVIDRLKRMVSDAYKDILGVTISTRSIKTTLDRLPSGLLRISRSRLNKKSTVTLAEQDYKSLRDRMQLNDDDLANAYIFQMLKRYTSPFSIFQYDPKLPNTYYDLLAQHGVKHHIISSPLANVYPTFGTLFPDIDALVQPQGTVTGDLITSEEYRRMLSSGGAGQSLELNLTGYGYLYQLYIKTLIEEVLSTSTMPITVYAVIDAVTGAAKLKSQPQVAVGPLPFRNKKQLLVILQNSLARPVDGAMVADISRVLDVKLPAVQVERENAPTIPPLEVNGRITNPVLTQFEKAKIIGMRAMQLKDGAPPLVPVDRTETNLIEIAERELYTVPRKFPLQVIRPLSDGTEEAWFVYELEDFSQH